MLGGALRTLGLMACDGGTPGGGIPGGAVGGRIMRGGTPVTTQNVLNLKKYTE